MSEVLKKEFSFAGISGISEKQLSEHYLLYTGYVKRINEIWSILQNTTNFGDPNTTYSLIRSLKLGESYALNGIKLHEMYFENMGGSRKAPYDKILLTINKDFGSYDNFIKLLINVGLSMRGWAVLCYEPIDSKLHIYGFDAHDVGSVIKCNPILVLDVYEHAYMIDFGTNRKKYIETFINNINWEIVNTRLIRCLPPLTPSSS